MSNSVNVGEEDDPQWLQVSRWGDDVVYVPYREGVVTMSSLELPADLAFRLGIELASLASVRSEHRAVYPAQLLEGSPVVTRVLPEEEAVALAAHVNARLVHAGLPEAAYVESREVYASPWVRDEQLGETNLTAVKVSEYDRD